MDVGSVVSAARTALYITLALSGCARATARSDPGATSRVPEEPLLIEFRLVRADPFPGAVVRLHKGDTVYVEPRAILSDPDLEVVEPDLGDGRLIIAFEATEEAGRRYRLITAEHVGEQLALLLEGQIANIVTIRSSLGPRGVVDAHMPREQATHLAILIQNRWRHSGVSRDTSSTSKTATLSSVREQVPFVVRSLNDSVTWEERIGYRRFSVTVQFVNRGAQPLYRHWCAVEVQRLIDGIWVTVQNPICVEGQPEFIALGPGDSAMQNVNVYRYPDPAHWYGDRRLIAGVYRLMFPIGYNYSAERGLVLAESESARSSQPFIVRDP